MLHRPYIHSRGKDYHPAPGVFTFGGSVHALDLGDDVVHHLAVGGAHGLHRPFLARFFDLGRHLAGELGQRLAPTLAVSRDVDMDPRAVPTGVVLHHGAHHLFQSLDRGSLRADERAQAVPLNVHRHVVVIDLGPGIEALDDDLLGIVDRLCVVVGPTTAQLQAAFCSVPLLERVVVAGSVVVGAGDDDAARIASRLPWPLLAAIPRDPFLAADEFATRAPTIRSIDVLIKALR